MTFAWLTPLIILILFSTVILFQDAIEQRSHRMGERQSHRASDKDEHGNA
ncbi:MAG: hypothetical protein JWR26_4153 [Pedosphaera sp.]|nr:hypothetical protein [Pedosphaera sp.]